MKFEFNKSRSQTIHVQNATLASLEDLRQQLMKNGKKPNYDAVIKFALSYLKAKGV